MAIQFLGFHRIPIRGDAARCRSSGQRRVGSHARTPHRRQSAGPETSRRDRDTRTSAGAEDFALLDRVSGALARA